MNNLELKYQFARKMFIFKKNYFQLDLWQISNSEKSLVLACCITNVLFAWGFKNSEPFDARTTC